MFLEQNPQNIYDGKRNSKMSNTRTECTHQDHTPHTNRVCNRMFVSIERILYSKHRHSLLVIYSLYMTA